MKGFNKPPQEKKSDTDIEQESPQHKNDSPHTRALAKKTTNHALAAALGAVILAPASLTGCSEQEKAVSRYTVEHEAKQTSIKVFLKKHGLPESAVHAFLKRNKKGSINKKGLKVGKKYTLPATETTKVVSLDTAMSARKVAEKFKRRLITYNTTHGRDFGIFSYRGHILIPDYGTGFYYLKRKKYTITHKPKKTVERNANKRAITKWSKRKKPHSVASYNTKKPARAQKDHFFDGLFSDDDRVKDAPKSKKPKILEKTQTPKTRSIAQTPDKIPHKEDSKLWLHSNDKKTPKKEVQEKSDFKYTGLPYLEAKKALAKYEGRGPLKDYCVVLDPGHGYLKSGHSDPGSVGELTLKDGSHREITETAIAYDVFARMLEKLSRLGAGVFSTHYSDEYGVRDEYNPKAGKTKLNTGHKARGQNTSLRARKKIAGDIMKDHAGKRKTVFISVHIDSIPDKKWRPIHIVIDNGGPKGHYDKESDELAKEILKHLSNDSYIKKQGLLVLRRNPATGEIIIELGNIANTKNANNMAHYKLREKYADILVDAIKKALLSLGRK